MKAIDSSNLFVIMRAGRIQALFFGSSGGGISVSRRGERNQQDAQKARHQGPRE